MLRYNQKEESEVIVMIRETKKLTKEQYDKIVANNFKINDALAIELVGEAIVWGYGFYRYSVRVEEDGYYLDYNRGATCD